MAVNGRFKELATDIFVSRIDCSLKKEMKCSRQKAINLSLNYLQNVKEAFMQLNKGEAYLFSSLIDNGVLTKELSLITDYLYYNIKVENFDIPNFGKKIYKMISSKDVNLEDLYKSKFCVSNILRAIGLDEELLDVSALEVRALTILYCSLNIIELIKCKTDKRIITGLQDGKLKYLTDNNLAFNCVNVRYTTMLEENTFSKYIRNISDRLRLKYPHLDIVEALALANDKVDECLQGITIDNIILSILDVKASVNRETRIKSVEKGIAVKVPVEVWENRDFVCEEPEVIYFDSSSNIKLMRILDTGLADNVPITIISYILKDGTEDTVILPNKQSSVIYSHESELTENLIDFYSGKTEKMSLFTDNVWSFRNNKDFEGKAREYKKKSTYVRWHRAKMGNPSEEKLKEAKKRGIKLKEGETWVRGHVRHYK